MTKNKQVCKITHVRQNSLCFLLSRGKINLFVQRLDGG